MKSTLEAAGPARARQQRGAEINRGAWRTMFGVQRWVEGEE